jgi:IMP dehydrogenase
VRFLHDAAPPHDLTYDDVFMVPRSSRIASRYDVDLATDDGTGATLPLVVANMTAIAGKRMAETTARRGGLTVIPQDIPIPVVADVVSWVKRRHHVFDTAIELHPTQTVAEALALMPKRAHRAAVVVDQGRPVGVVTESDCAEVDRFAQVGQVMNRELVLVAHDADPRAVFDELEAAKATLAVAVYSPVSVPCARRSTRQPSTRAEGFGSQPRWASTETSPTRRRACSRPGWTRWSWTRPTVTRTG